MPKYISSDAHRDTEPAATVVCRFVRVSRSAQGKPTGLLNRRIPAQCAWRLSLVVPYKSAADSLRAGRRHLPYL
jgi:hypothetical protein